MTTRHHITRLICRLAITVGTAFCFAIVVSPAEGGSTPYGWPVKPFGIEHPVRGVLGDPRTIFAAPPTTEGALHGAGDFQFHFGIDISAPDGTAVYPVVSGTVSRRDRDRIDVTCPDGRIFQYWHVDPVVAVRDRVTERETVIGHVVRGTKHVHLSELRHGVFVNPLATGHLAPYTDRIAPVVASISIRTSPATSVLPNLVRGRVDFVVEAYDVTNRPVTGIWSNMPVSPALISWTIRDLRPRAVVRPTVAVDFRQGIPDNADFWRVYERGSFQNMSVFAKHYSYRQPGRYLYRLSRSTFDTRRLQDGVYDLVVTASDIRGNRTTSSLRLTLANGVDGRDS